MDEKQTSGLNYSLTILQDDWQPILIFWLGFRPLLRKELTKLVPELSASTLDEKLTALRNLRIVNPIKDTENRYSLTEQGADLRHMILSLSIWGKEQLDDNADKLSQLMIEPENNAKVEELLKFKPLLNEYIN